MKRKHLRHHGRTTGVLLNVRKGTNLISENISRTKSGVESERVGFNIKIPYIPPPSPSPHFNTPLGKFN